jgi:hypothetical protein
VPELLHKCPAVEHAQIVHRRLLTMSSLIERATGKTLGRLPVLQVDRGHHRLSPEFRQHSPLLQERARHCHHHLISPLHHPVLLWGVRHQEVLCDPLVSIVGGELGRRELPTIVGPQHPELVAALLLYHLLNVSDGVVASDLAARSATHI